MMKRIMWQEQNQSEDVKLLSNQVNERLRQAIESDTVLAGIYKDLRNGAVVHSSEEETGTETVRLFWRRKAVPAQQAVPV
ncbi:MAG: hypothetical protein ACLR0U_17705 [Enterocloster clostridioformis]